MLRARSSSVSSEIGRSSASSPTAAPPPRTSAGHALSTKVDAACSLSPTSPSAGGPARPRTARPSGPNKPSPVATLVTFLTGWEAAYGGTPPAGSDVDLLIGSNLAARSKRQSPGAKDGITGSDVGLRLVRELVI